MHFVDFTGDSHFTTFGTARHIGWRSHDQPLLPCNLPDGLAQGILVLLSERSQTTRVSG